MCQLFALSSNAPTAVNFSFTGFSARGGATAEHADGWGIAFHDAGGSRVFVDDSPACASPLAEFLRRHPIRATTVLAHIRKATEGAVQLSNCHPFQRQWLGRPWSFCHNGHLKGYAPALGASHRPVGSTDSESAFCWLLQQLQQHFVGHDSPPPWTAVAPVLADLACQLAAHGSLNFLLTDGQALYAHCSTHLHWVQRRHPFPQVRLVDADLSLDLSRDNGPDDRMVLVATAPLTHDEPWQAMAPGELRVFVDGQCVGREQRTLPAAALQASAATAAAAPLAAACPRQTETA